MGEMSFSADLYLETNLMKLVHISDIHIHHEDILDTAPIDNFAQVLANVEQYHADADKIVITGDLTHYGLTGSYRTLRTMLEKSKLRGKLAPQLLLGNHDDRKNFASIFPDTKRDENGFIQSVEKTDAGLFIYMDTEEPGTHAGHYCDKRQRWLRIELECARETRQPVYLFMHHNPIAVHVANADEIGIVQEAELQQILADYRDVIRHIFFGHCHFTLSGSVVGIPFSAPRSTNHPCWPDFTGSAGRMGYSALDADYNVCFLSDKGTVVHTINFQRQMEAKWRMEGESVAREEELIPA